MSASHQSTELSDVTLLADQVQLSAAESLERDERLVALREHLACLTDQQQEILRLRLQCELSYKQIAEVLDLTVSNVGYHMHTAIMALRGRLA